MPINIYHLFHSGVAVEINNMLLVFDYYKDNSRNSRDGLAGGVVTGDQIEKYEQIYVFASHSHYDHFNPVIFEWKQYNKNIDYILSDDINVSEDAHFLKKGDSISVNNLDITAYGSTDKGVSFLVQVKLDNEDGIIIFHSGDLNWWYWKSFTSEQLKQEERDFKEEVDKLKKYDIDIAFVPVDPRLDEYYYLAGEYFIETIKPSLFVPIHFAGKYSITEKFADKYSQVETDIAVIESRGKKINWR
ncbi:MAG: MBL fold metallo-hydrolase [Bacillota bacterium]